MAKTVNPNYTQSAFAKVTDDGSETGSTVGTTNLDWSENVNTVFRVRIAVAQTEAATTNLTQTFTLYYSYNSGAYTAVPAIAATSAPIRFAASAETSWSIADGDATTDRGVSSGAFIAGQYRESDPSGNVTFTNGSSSETEMEFCVEIYGDYAGLANDDTIDLRVYDGAGVALGGGYQASLTPGITVSGIATASPIAGATTVTVKAGNTDGETANLDGWGELKKSPAETIAFGHLADLNGRGELKKSPAETIAFSESATLSVPVSSIVGSATIAFVDPGTTDLNGKGELKKDPAETIAFSEVADLNGKGELKKSPAETIAFSTSATLTAPVEKGAWSGTSISPLVLSTQPYSFTTKAGGGISATAAIAFTETADLNGLGDLAATASVGFTETADLNGIGDLAGSVSFAFSETADLNGSGDLAAAESIAFSEAADLNAKGELQASTTIAFSEVGSLVAGAMLGSTSIGFSESADLNGTGELAGAVSVALSETADLNGLGDLAAAASVAFTESANLVAAAAKGVWSGTSISPLVLSTQPYSFVSKATGGAIQAAATIAWSETADLNGLGDLAASTPIAFSETADLNAVGQLQGSVSIAFSEVAVLALGPITGSTSISFSETAALTADGDLAASASIAFGETATIRSIGPLQASESIAVSETADLNGTGSLQATPSLDFTGIATMQADGELQGSVSVAFSESATARLVGEQEWQISPLILPIGNYNFVAKQIALKGDTAISFSTTSTLTAKGSLGGDNISASTTIDLFQGALWLVGSGRLYSSVNIAIDVSGSLLIGTISGATSIGFGETGVLSATGRLASSTSVDVAASASILGVGGDNISASTSIGFTVNGSLARGPIASSQSIAFSENANLRGRAGIASATSIDFSTTVDLKGRTSLSGSTSIAFSETGVVYAKGSLLGSSTVKFQVTTDFFRGPMLAATAIQFSTVARVKNAALHNAFFEADPIDRYLRASSPDGYYVTTDHDTYASVDDRDTYGVHDRRNKRFIA